MAIWDAIGGALANAAKTTAKVGATGVNLVLPGNPATALVNKVGGYNYSLDDPTPGYSATNVLRTQFGSPAQTVSPISTPTYGQTGSTSGSDSMTTVPTSTTGYASWTPQQQGYFDSAIAQYNAQLGRIPGELTSANQNINSNYNNTLQDYQTGLKNAQTQYDQGLTKAQQDYLTSQNQVQGQGAQDQRSLLNMLAAMGAGGGSEAQFLIPQLVGQNEAQQIAGAGQTLAGNRRNLDTALHTYQDNEKQQEKGLATWLTQQLNSAKSTALTNEQGIQDNIGQLQAQRASATGGDVMSALQPYMSKVNSLASKIDALANFNPQYSGQVQNYVAPSLSSFTPGRQADIQAQIRQNAGGNPSSYLALLAGMPDQKKNQANNLF